jgi:uncharacterized protein (TIGR03032 family)
MTSLSELERLWAHHHAEWRDPAQIASQWREASAIDPALLRGQARGHWWDLLDELGITLLISREYEHLVMALAAPSGRPCATFLPLPHPSGLVVDRASWMVHLASTRNPNALYSLVPVGDPEGPPVERPLMPVGARFLPGCLYLHDLALVDGALHANAVGQNAVIRLGASGRYERVWWPACIERPEGPAFERNYLQLNSIAAGPNLADSYFSASGERLSARRPGHRNYPVDRRGVIFSGRTREPVVRGLTRPHSARPFEGRVWVDNSGYGELGFGQDGRFEPLVRLPGWTRGLAFAGRIAFVGTSRVIPRFRRYAPGLDADASRCGLHAVDVDSGRVLGSLTWPSGNQIFAIDWLPSSVTLGLPFVVGRRPAEHERRLFYTFAPQGTELQRTVVRSRAS